MTRGVRAAAAIALVAVAAAACGRHDDPQSLADETTRAVYDNDVARTTAHFDDAAKAQASRASVGALSDKMHALGAYHGLKRLSGDPDKGRYDYQAEFDKGTMLVQIRMDPDGKVGAYRVATP